METGYGYTSVRGGLGAAQVIAEPRVAPYLKFEDGDGKEIPLIPGSAWKIGRTEQNAVVLIDDMVSRNHAMIQQLENGQYYLVDMGSRNGSFVNGSRVTAPQALRDGDQLSFGQIRLRFNNPAQVEGGEAPIAAPDSGARGRTMALFRQATVSVLVVDIRGFTVLAQKIDAGLLGRLMSTWFAEVDRIVHHYGGAAEKHIGDAVMTLWTHSAKGYEHVEILRMLRAVVDAARMTGRMHEAFDLPEPMRIGAGVNTGLAAIGNTGAKGVSDFTAIGEGVNAAFRLESATKELNTDLVLGAATFDYLCLFPEAVRYFQTSQAQLKGYDAPVKTWHISFGELGEFLLHRHEDRGTIATPPLGPRSHHA